MRKSALILTILLCSCTDPSEKSIQKTGAKVVTRLESTAVHKQVAEQMIEVRQNEPVNVKAALTGTLADQTPALHKGGRVRKGQLLARFDNTALFLKLRAEKRSLRDELINVRPGVTAPDSTVFSRFVRELEPNSLLPAFPKLSLSTLQLLNEHNLLDQYDALAAEETTMHQYFVFAPVDGRIVSVTASAELAKGDVVLTIVPDGFSCSPSIPGKPGTTIVLKDAHGNHVTAVIRRQSARTTYLGGRLKAGKYVVTTQ